MNKNKIITAVLIVTALAVTVIMAYAPLKNAWKMRQIRRNTHEAKAERARKTHAKNLADFNAFLKKSASCSADSDCALVSADCKPECAAENTINKKHLNAAEKHIEKLNYGVQCKQPLCVCVQAPLAACENKKCVLKQQGVLSCPAF